MKEMTTLTHEGATPLPADTFGLRRFSVVLRDAETVEVTRGELNAPVSSTKELAA